MSNLKVLILTISVGILSGIIIIIAFYIFLANGLSLDESEILKDTREAFVKEKFNKEVFDRADDIKKLSMFLIRNADTLVSSERNILKKESNLTNNKGNNNCHTFNNCYIFNIYKQKYISQYFPPFLIDSVNYYKNTFDYDNIVKFVSLCGSKNTESINKFFGNISFKLYINEREKINPNYHIEHLILYNKKIEINNSIKSIWDGALVKDTILTDNLHYIIRITPYTGF